MSVIAEDLKQHVDIVEVISRHVQLKRAWSNYTGLCPFHREKSPSFMVSQDKQMYKCFGCWLGGDVISFVMEYDKVDFWDAVKELSTRYHFDLTSYQSDKLEDYHDTKDQREKIKLINKLTTKRFCDQLAQHPHASDYVYDRRHMDDETIARWRVWYAPSNGQLLSQYLQSKGFATTDLTEAWLVRQWQSGDMYSFFRDRMMFPISDHVGNVVWFGGRIINPEDNPKYLNTWETAIYQKSKILYGLHEAKTGIKEHQQVIIVEGYMDVIALDRLDLPIGVAPCGTSLTIDHIKLLTRYTDNIVMMFDNDSAGQAAGLRSVKLLLEQWIYPKIISLPAPHKDIDDLANTQDLTMDEKQVILTSPVDWFDALIVQLQVAYPLDHPVATKQLINEMFAVLTVIGDYSVFVWYMTKLAKLVNVDEHGLMNDYKTRYRNSKQQYRQTSNNDTSTKYEEDVNLLLVSVAQHDIYRDYSTLNDAYQLALDLGVLGGAHSYSDTQLQEWLLWWSRTIDQLSADRQLQEIQQFVSRYIQSQTQIIIKSNKLTLDEKQAYLTRIKGIK